MRTSRRVVLKVWMISKRQSSNMFKFYLFSTKYIVLKRLMLFNKVFICFYSACLKYFMSDLKIQNLIWFNSHLICPKNNNLKLAIWCLKTKTPFSLYDDVIKCCGLSPNRQNVYFASTISNQFLMNAKWNIVM